jgi:ADP-ribosylglycohydrolase
MTEQLTEQVTGSAHESHQLLPLKRANAALRALFIGDALAMPVHWYYNPQDIDQAFPGGIRKLEAPPRYHPSSIMALHSTQQGGRGSQASGSSTRSREVVGDIILKGKRQFWGQPNMHYHHRLQAGDNTLNAHCTRLLMRTLVATKGGYDPEQFLQAYIAFMTADEPQHPDTYAESYHRAFFANYAQGKAPADCAGTTHDTPSIGGLVMIAPLAISALLAGTPVSEVQVLCRQHLYLTHPDADLARVCADYVALINALLFRDSVSAGATIVVEAAGKILGVSIKSLLGQIQHDSDVVGSHFSTACYISGSWPSVMFLAGKYVDDPRAGLLSNTNLGGDNVHRGAVLGVLLGLASDTSVSQWFGQLTDRKAIDMEIQALLPQAS